MKKYILIFAVFICKEIIAQKKIDSVRLAIREKIKKYPGTDDYSNFNNDIRGRTLEAKILGKQKLEHSIVVINNKIFKLDAKEYLRLTKDSISGNPIIIKDASSSSGINYILIIKTKTK